ncbi:hypothetical protein FFF34_003170 [Inquilinus sp. KBS0705]|nr:hypothetical protein FFF34_003170 [Inquilinus sp. KBS0705]
METLETMYHLIRISGDGNAGKYRFSHRSGKLTKLDSIINAETVAYITLSKPHGKNGFYSNHILKVGNGDTSADRFRLIITCLKKVGSGTGRTDLFRDNSIVTFDGESVTIFMHRLACPTSLPSKAGTSDETKLYIGDDKDYPYRRYLRNDKDILSEMKLLTLDATRL